MRIEDFVDLLEARGKEVKRKPGYFEACCPAHDDKSPSLWVKEGADGAILIACRAGCDKGQILASLGLKWADLFPPRPPKWTGKHIETERVGKDIVYAYEIEPGQTLFEVVRQNLLKRNKETGEERHSKRFMQRRKVGPRNVWRLEEGWVRWEGKGTIFEAQKEKPDDGYEWAYCPPILRVLFRLPQVLEECRRGGTVWLCEGEKDALALVEAGVCASCNSQGAGKWEPQYTDMLAGAGEVVICLDNDGPGVNHARMVGDELGKAGLAVSYRLPAKGKDAADHLGAGLGIKDFIEVSRADLDIPREDEKAVSGISESEWTEMGNADRFARDFGGDLRYSPERKRWFVWTGRRGDKGAFWEEDVSVSGEAFGLYREMMQRMRAQTAELDAQVAEAVASEDVELVKKKQLLRQKYLRHIERSEQVRSAKASLEWAGQRPPIMMRVDQMDQEEMIVACENGYLNLAAGDRIEPDRGLNITKRFRARFDPSARCPTWIKFLADLTSGDEDLAEMLQRALGYSLTGSTYEKCFFFIHGPGDTGKSQLVKFLMKLWGNYAFPVAPDKLMTKKNESEIPTWLASTAGMRIISVSEVKDDQRFDEGLMKRLTGGDEITARFMRENDFSFIPIAKIWMMGNDLPRVASMDSAFWRRVVMIPATNQIPPERRDQHLLAKLWAERDGIFSWMVEGARLWSEDGLRRCAASEAAWVEYQVEMDVVGRWLQERTREGHPGQITSFDELQKDFVAWCKEGSVFFSAGRFTRELKRKLAERKMEPLRPTGSKTYYPLMLLDSQGSIV